jgi:predicted metalloprotease
MRWTPGAQSGDVEDRRGQSYGGGFRGGPASIGIILVLLVLSLLTGRNLLGLLGPGTIESIESPSQTSGPPGDESPEEKRLFQFVDFVVGDAQNTWAQLLGNGYRRATVVVFRGATPTACGVGQSAMGPFYCPLDEKVYIDLGFYDELRRRFGAPGDFAQAYVITHEIGHHVQHLRGIDSQVRQLQEQRPDVANQLSVRLELQADCLAGVWGHSTAQRNLLERGDVEEALNAAAAIGDDRIQSSTGRGVQPDSFTHGSSTERVQWFRRGLESGDVSSCDTFGRGTN